MERKIPLPMLALAILGFAYMLLPILVVVLAGLTAGEFLTFPPKGLSLRWVAAFLQSEKYLSAFFFSAGNSNAPPGLARRTPTIRSGARWTSRRITRPS